ncbi:hypothetical protein D3C77_523580 [compost metagenome]
MTEKTLFLFSSPVPLELSRGKSKDDVIQASNHVDLGGTASEQQRDAPCSTSPRSTISPGTDQLLAGRGIANALQRLQHPLQRRGNQRRQRSANDSPIILTPAAFQQTLNYLASNRHFDEAPAVAFRSRHWSANSGPFCHAARHQPDGLPDTVVITYILPILERCQAVAIERDVRPTSTWLAA